jgi:hypothetical protein
VVPRLLALVILACLAVVACSPVAFDPSGPCTSDGRMAGAYVELENMIPATVAEAPPTRVDSGRSCSPESIQNLAELGITELRYAGGLWERGSRSGTTVAVFTAPGLTADAMSRWYEISARQDNDVEDIVVEPFDAGGQPGRRLDSLVETSSFQSVVAWPAPQADTVRVVLVGTDVREHDRATHEAAVRAAVASFND